MKLTPFVALILVSFASQFGVLETFSQVAPNSIMLAQVKRIYIPLDPPPGREKSAYWSNPDSAEFQKLLFGSLVKYKRVRPDHPGGPKSAPEGDCGHGFDTEVSGVKVVCRAEDADAELLGYIASDSEEVSTTTGTVSDSGDVDATTRSENRYRFAGGASLSDVQTSATLWESKKAAQSVAMTLLAPNAVQRPSDVAVRVVGQLKKDIRAARK